MGGAAYAGKMGDWQAACRAATTPTPAPPTQAEVVRFFEEHFTPVSTMNRGEKIGLFTGYYEAELQGSRARSDGYATPLYPRPGDLVSVELGLFSEEWKGRRIAGRVEAGALKPFESRAEIVAGGLDSTLTRSSSSAIRSMLSFWRSKAQAG
jgi:membrane-bound lytic murein transglycosylase A